ncbi:Substance-K receptor [Sciurus carolinensis]|uniref:Substance-K receptor n=1 Tax=Sciurus carolinensis TaxID=30640 RepID=A0AA41N958_SCICA|nr:Substance-K receptor [Sciurus carolinensis]
MGACALLTDANISSGLESNTTDITAFSMPGWQLSLWATAYLALVLVAVTGNATVIWIILAHPRMRTVTNYFIVNLALADLCMAAFNTPFNFVYASHNVWYFGRVFCHFQNLFPITAMFVSIYSMTAIAADRQEGDREGREGISLCWGSDPVTPGPTAGRRPDGMLAGQCQRSHKAQDTKVGASLLCRGFTKFEATPSIVLALSQAWIHAGQKDPEVTRYMAIVHPFQPRLSAPGTKAVIAGIWLVALALAFPQCFYSAITVDEGATKCVVAWPEDSRGKSLLQYHLVVIALIYLLPLLVMFIAYSIIGLTLWGHALPRHQVHGANLRHLQAKKKFVKTMVLVVVAFAVCWLPYHLYFILGSLQEDIYCHKFIQQVYLALFWLAMSSTMYNPIIYCSLNHRFRSGFRLAFRCCPWVTPAEEDKLELTPTPSLSMRVNRCHTKEILFTAGDMAASEVTNGKAGVSPRGEAC